MDVFQETTPDELLAKYIGAALSNRELQVFRLIGDGMPPAAIADALDLSTKTVATYRARILEKLEIDSNAEIAVLSWRTRKFNS